MELNNNEEKLWNLVENYFNKNGYEKIGNNILKENEGIPEYEIDVLIKDEMGNEYPIELKWLDSNSRKNIKKDVNKANKQIEKIMEKNNFDYGFTNIFFNIFSTITI